MLSPLRRSAVELPQSLIERLEERRLLSVGVPTASVAAATSAADTTDVTANTAVLTGVSLHAQTGQFFRAVVGTIKNFPLVAAVYRIRGTIDWGDGTPKTFANFVRLGNGSLAVLGGHTYANVGTNDITVTITTFPPPFSMLPVLLIGTFHSTATVFAPNGGVTLSEPVNVHFTARVGFFRTAVSPTLVAATIDWGDGSQSQGKIVPLPTADPLAAQLYAVVGDHTYTAVGSYLLTTTVYELTPAGIGPTTIAKFNSVIDVLPISPVAALLPGDVNGDGVVDVTDLGDLASNYGVSTGDATWDMGDFNGDGNIDVTDLGDLASSYGDEASMSVATATGAAAPVSTPAATPGNAAALAAVSATSATATSDTTGVDNLFSTLPIGRDRET